MDPRKCGNIFCDLEFIPKVFNQNAITLIAPGPNRTGIIQLRYLV